MEYIENKQQMADVNLAISVTKLNMTGLNIPIKRQRLSGWIKKQDATIFFLQETFFRPTDTDRLDIKGWKRI